MKDGETALIVGMGASGRAAAKLCLALGMRVHLYDQRPIADPPKGATAFVDAAQIPDAAFAGVDLIVLSPGVPPAAPRARAAACAPQARIVGEMSLALEVLAQRKALPRLCLVTGTNGKSTITALIGHLLTHALAQGDAGRVFCGGNLGTAVSELTREVVEGGPAPEFMVLECSSYQLETLHARAFDDHPAPFPVEVAILSNLSPDHLARYESLEAYAQTKTAIFEGLGDTGLALLDHEDAWTPRLRPAGRCVEIQDPAGPHLSETQLELDAETGIPRDQLRIAGRHNAKNALFALAAAREMGAAPAALAEALTSFEGLPHRMVFVAERDAIAYYDDSKATNVASTLAGIDGFSRPFVLLAGGQLKGEDLTPLIDCVAAQGRALIAFGEGGPTLEAAAEGRVPCERVPDLEQALAAAQRHAQAGDAIILSPAGASWDAYANFAERGRHFAALVRR